MVCRQASAGLLLACAGIALREAQSVLRPDTSDRCAIASAVSVATAPSSAHIAQRAGRKRGQRQYHGDEFCPAADPAPHSARKRCHARLERLPCRYSLRWRNWLRCYPVPTVPPARNQCGGGTQELGTAMAAMAWPAARKLSQLGRHHRAGPTRPGATAHPFKPWSGRCIPCCAAQPPRGRATAAHLARRASSSTPQRANGLVGSAALGRSLGAPCKRQIRPV